MDKKVILIADDEPHIIELIRLTLGEEEYEYIEAENGKQVLELAEKRNPDLILLDIMMPVVDGYEVARKLKSNEKTKNIVIAMVSAKKEDQDVLKGIDKGALAYITKPFNPMELEEKVKELLQL
jgi:DNA-binding response OmpR family regulator